MSCVSVDVVKRENETILRLRSGGEEIDELLVVEREGGRNP